VRVRSPDLQGRDLRAGFFARVIRQHA
jgi:hypothetical protein